MRWTTWFLFGLAVAVFGGLFAMVARQSARSPAEFFASIQKKIDAKALDEEAAISNLDLAFERAEAARDANLAAEVRLARAKVLTRIGSWDRARNDLEAVEALRGAPREIEELLVDLEARSGDVTKALARLDALLAKDAGYSAGWARATARRPRRARRRRSGSP
ncbi:MAG: hypothetical protein HZA53_18545, partial [Planctomycetes bacterium]|nr:hypothetical protein [Planctomycetota bacterium]